MNRKEIHRIVDGLKSSLFKNSNSTAIGVLKSQFRGTGLQFKEHRQYQHGDDVRFIDWKLLAKSGDPYIKTFEEERNIEIVVILDCGPTMLHGYKDKSKLMAGIEICCLLYLLARQTGDMVHVLLLLDGVHHIPKSCGEEGIVKLVSFLEEKGILLDSGKTNSTYNYQTELNSRELNIGLYKHLSKKREIVLASDFVNFLDDGQMDRMIKSSHVHLFRLKGPLDEYTGKNRLLFGKSGFLGGSSTVGMTASMKEEFERLDKKYHKRIKQLNVKDGYLEDFVKSLL